MEDRREKQGSSGELREEQEIFFRSRIDPELRAAYDASAGFGIDHLDTWLPESDASEMALLREDPEVRAKDLIVPGPADHPELLVRVYEPADRRQERIPAILFFHGGGFLFGTRIRQNDMCQRYCKNAHAIVVSVEYRRAPEFRAPAALEDCYAALVWLADPENGLLADPDRIAVMGLSAGGNLAAAVSILARDRKGPGIVLQLPLYAELDCRMGTVSAQEVTSPKVWSKMYSEISWDLYLGGQEPNGYISPSLCEDLSGLPPLFSYIGGCDPLRDENIEYWSRMMKAGVEVEAHIFPGGFHCSEISAPDASCSRAAYELTYRALNRAFYGIGQN